MKPAWLLYEGLWMIIRGILRLAAFLKPELKAQVTGRSWDAVQLDAWQSKRKEHRRCVIFFSSSAGEYEQAKPLASLLAQNHDCFVLLIIASASGTRFAAAQNEKLPFHKSPWDRPLAWQQLIQTLKPDFFVVVRYELWPGFLSVARAKSPVYLIDAVRSERLQKAALPRLFWKFLLRRVSRVYAVGDDDASFYEETLGLSRQKIAVVGDSKYDRVLQRMTEKKAYAVEMRSQLQLFLGSSRTLILGSAWPEDLETFLEGYCALAPELRSDVKIIVAPHDVSSAMAERMQRLMENRGLQVCRVSTQGIAAASRTDDVLLVDALGYLAELYACAHLAWVGGGMHHRVHNVLEAACRGIYLCFGPRFGSSQEALWLVSQNLVQVVRQAQDFTDWFQRLNWDRNPPHRALWQAVKRQEGASERMLQSMLAAEAPTS